MDELTLAAWLGAYRLNLRESLQTAAGQGYRLVHAPTTTGDLNPREFADSARRHLRKYLQDLGLRLDGLAVLHPGLGLADPASADVRVSELRDALALAADLGVHRTTVRVGGLDDPRTRPLAEEMFGVVADLSERFGIATAVSSTADSPADVAVRVRALGTPRVGLAVDTAQLPAGGASADWVDLLALAYLRDGRRGPTAFEETPLGQGDVDFAALLAQFEAAPHAPALVVRHDGPGGVDALRRGREYMRSLVGGDRPRP